jgi:hypothetical protein
MRNFSASFVIIVFTCIRQRALAANGATLARLTNAWQYKESVDEHDNDDVKIPDAMKSIENVRQTLEDIDHYLERKRGIDGAPLAYIVRSTVEAGDEAATQQFGLPTFDGDLIARVRHEGTAYQQDNKLVWTMLRSVFHGGPGWNWNSSYACVTNGRAAYLAVNFSRVSAQRRTRLLTIPSLTVKPARLHLRNIVSA